MKIILVDLSHKCVSALQTEFYGTRVEVMHGNITQPCIKGRNVAIATAGNSFGQMDGGIDGHINIYLSNGEKYIQYDVKQLISKLYFGEQPVGTCLLVKSLNSDIGFLAHAPTMRVPKDISNTINAYLAFRAVLTSIIRHNRECKNTDTIDYLLCPMFCCGAGCMKSEVAAKQMRMAFDSVMYAMNRDTCTDWKTIWDGDRKICNTVMAAAP